MRERPLRCRGTGYNDSGRWRCGAEEEDAKGWPGLIMSTTLELEPTTPEVKQYQRAKITAGIASAVLALGWLALMALVLGPAVGAWLTEQFGDVQALRLLVMAALVTIGMEVLVLPLDFWSGYVLEHRYQLSNQTIGGWV